jgi:hypothetical protein
MNIHRSIQSKVVRKYIRFLSDVLSTNYIYLDARLRIKDSLCEKSLNISILAQCTGFVGTINRHLKKPDKSYMWILLSAIKQ